MSGDNLPRLQQDWRASVGVGGTIGENNMAVSFGKIMAVIFGLIFMLMGIGLFFGGAAVVAVTEIFTDDDNYFMSPVFQLKDDSAVAFVLEDIEIEVGEESSPEWVQPDYGDFVRIKIQVEGPPNDGYFVGIAEATEVQSYLSEVPYAVIKDVNFDHGPAIEPDLVNPLSNKTLASTPPEESVNWDAFGNDGMPLIWEPKEGDWMIVIMKADGTAGMDASIRAGAEVPFLQGLGIALLVFGILFIVLAIVLFALAARRSGTKPEPTQPTYYTPPTAVTAPAQPQGIVPDAGVPAPKAMGYTDAQPVAQSREMQPAGEEVYVVADWMPRIAAFIIDVLIVSFVVELFRWPLIFGTDSWSFIFFPFGFGANSVALVIYWTLMEGYYGTSIGKEIMGLMVIREDGERPEWGDVLLSAVGKAFILPIDLIIGAFTNDPDPDHGVPLNQRLLQKASKTLVVTRPPSSPPLIKLRKN